MRVEKGAVPVLLWCLATTASIGVASLALRPVLRTAVPQDSIPVAAGDDRGDRKVATQTLPPPSAAPSTPDTVIIEDPSSAFTPPPTSPGATRTTQAPPTQKTTAPPRTVDGWTVTTGSDGVDVYLKSFRSEGGDAVVRIRAEVVSLVTATPREGYSVSQAQNEPARLVVQFVSDSGGAAYLVDCMWWQGGPHGSVTKVGN
ncbi:hypothetical protein ACQP1P_29420 [Dactylosporangium sp. CA-052675]|uniref:hypothetical protein n=1 Tax=Dactylosporangium sp. CA-052675 TaxID=3239927 RepID=UPI003D92B790